MARDSRVDKELMAMGWTPIRFWSKEVKKNLSGCINRVEEAIVDIIKASCETVEIDD